MTCPSLESLFLQNLENVESKEQASEARLGSKRNLKDLRLYWGVGSHTDPGWVLEGLEPHQNLEHLGIKGYTGKCASWWSRNFCYVTYVRLG